MTYQFWLLDYDLRLPKRRSAGQRVLERLCALRWWRVEGDQLTPREYSFQADEEFVKDLKLLAELGVTGFVKLLGEGEEYYKYVLKREKVLVFWGRVVYSRRPRIL